MQEQKLKEIYKGSLKLWRSPVVPRPLTDEEQKALKAKIAKNIKHLPSKGNYKKLYTADIFVCADNGDGTYSIVSKQDEFTTAIACGADTFRISVLEKKSKKELDEYCIQDLCARRHMSDNDKVAYILYYYNLCHSEGVAKGKKNLKQFTTGNDESPFPVKTVEKIQNIVGVGEQKINRVIHIYKHKPSYVDEILAGNKTVNSAYLELQADKTAPDIEITAGDDGKCGPEADPEVKATVKISHEIAKKTVSNDDNDGGGNTNKEADKSGEEKLNGNGKKNENRKNAKTGADIASEIIHELDMVRIAYDAIIDKITEAQHTLKFEEKTDQIYDRLSNLEMEIATGKNRIKEFMTTSSSLN